MMSLLSAQARLSLANGSAAGAESDCWLALSWLIESWLVRIRWWSLPLGLPLLVLVRGPAACGLVGLAAIVAGGNLWLRTRLDRCPSRGALIPVRLVSTALGWLAAIGALGLSIGSHAHATLPALFPLLILTATARFGLLGLATATLAAMLAVGGSIVTHLAILGGVGLGSKLALVVVWEAVIAVAALVAAGGLQAIRAWLRSEEQRRADLQVAM